MNTFELQPINGRKSFGGKVKTEDNISYLYSYSTNVAEYNHTTNEMKVNGYYSQTTTSHINAFLDFYGFNVCTKKELENYNK